MTEARPEPPKAFGRVRQLAKAFGVGGRPEETKKTLNAERPITGRGLEPDLPLWRIRRQRRRVFLKAEMLKAEIRRQKSDDKGDSKGRRKKKAKPSAAAVGT